MAAVLIQMVMKSRCVVNIVNNNLHNADIYEYYFAHAGKRHLNRRLTLSRAHRRAGPQQISRTMVGGFTVFFARADQKNSRWLFLGANGRRVLRVAPNGAEREAAPGRGSSNLLPRTTTL